MELDIIRKIIPYIIFIFFLLFGFFIDKLILNRLNKFNLSRNNSFVKLILKSLDKIFILWFILIGLLFLSQYIHIIDNVKIYFYKLILIIFITSIIVVLSKIVVGIININTYRIKEIIPVSTIFSNLAKIIIYIIGLLIILQIIGISITPLLTTLGVGGIAVALALQDTLSNFFAGINILLSKQLKPGDYIKLSTGEEGYIYDINWRNTTIRNLQNNMVVIPNSKLSSTVVINYYCPESELALLVDLSVSYENDLEKVEKVTLEVAEMIQKTNEGCSPNFKPLIRFHTFAESGINFTVILKVKEYSCQFTVKHEFLKAIHKRFKEENITIPYPTRKILLTNT